MRARFPNADTAQLRLTLVSPEFDHPVHSNTTALHDDSIIDGLMDHLDVVLQSATTVNLDSTFQIHATV